MDTDAVTVTDDDADERNPNRDDKSGQYSAGFSSDDAVAALQALQGAGTTSEVGEEMGAARRTAYNKLSDAEGEGRVRSRDAGGVKLWLLEGSASAGEQSDREE